MDKSDENKIYLWKNIHTKSKIQKYIYVECLMVKHKKIYIKRVKSKYTYICEACSGNVN